MKWFFDALAKYAVFSGRSSRRAYWMFFLFTLIFSLVFGFVVGILGVVFEAEAAAETVINLSTLALLIPSFSCVIRRMHDTGRNGWWCIVPIVGLVFACQAGDPQENKYGPAPLVD